MSDPTNDTPAASGANQDENAFVRAATEELTDPQVLEFILDDDADASYDAVVVNLNDTLAGDAKTAAAQQRSDYRDPLLAPLDNTDMKYIEKVRAEIEANATAAAQTATAAGGTEAQAAAAATGSVEDALNNLPEGTDPAILALVQTMHADMKANNDRIQTLERTNEQLVQEKRTETRKRQKANFKAATAAGEFAISEDLQEIAYNQAIAVRKQIQAKTGVPATMGTVLTTMKNNYPGLFTPTTVDGDPAPAQTPEEAAASAAAANAPAPAPATTKRTVKRKAPPKTPAGATEPAATTAKPKNTSGPRPESLQDCANNMINGAYDLGFTNN